VTEVQPAGGQPWRQRETSTNAARGLPDWAIPAAAWALAALMLLLATAFVPLSITVRQNPVAAGAAQVVTSLAFAMVGLVVALHRPRNPIGWLMFCMGAVIMLYIDTGLYNVLNYRLGYHLPLAPVVLVLYNTSGTVTGLLPLIILVFPDGRLPSPRWRPAVGGYLVLGLADMAVQAQMSVYALTHHRTHVDTSGLLLLSNGAYSVFFAPVGIIFFAAWLLAVVYQIVRWRRSAGESRQQLSWLMAGGAVALVSFIAGVVISSHHGIWQTVGNVFVIGVAALPAGMGVAILKYRLFEIDRIISRTLAYTIVTGLLVGVYAGLVLLATRVLSVSSPVAVAASTLAAAALFTPARRRVQRVVDRRFNRVRYDGDRMVEAFAVRLKDAVDLETVRADLASVVSQALEPAHVSVWINERG
jgi:hypothetical protein